MYTVNKGPSKIVAKTRRGLAQNFEKFESIKESSKKGNNLKNAGEKQIIPRPVFQQSFANKRIAPTKLIEDVVITPQHAEIINYINESWNILIAENPYDSSKGSSKDMIQADANNNNAIASNNMVNGNGSTVPNTAAAIIAASPLSSSSAAAAIWVEPPSPALNDFKPFDLESWWGSRLFHNITKSL